MGSLGLSQIVNLWETEKGLIDGSSGTFMATDTTTPPGPKTPPSGPPITIPTAASTFIETHVQPDGSPPTTTIWTPAPGPKAPPPQADPGPPPPNHPPALRFKQPPAHIYSAQAAPALAAPPATGGIVPPKGPPPNICQVKVAPQHPPMPKQVAAAPVPVTTPVTGPAPVPKNTGPALVAPQPKLPPVGFQPGFQQEDPQPKSKRPPPSWEVAEWRMSILVSRLTTSGATGLAAETHIVRYAV